MAPHFDWSTLSFFKCPRAEMSFLLRNFLLFWCLFIVKKRFLRLTHVICLARKKSRFIERGATQEEKKRLEMKFKCYLNTRKKNLHLCTAHPISQLLSGERTSTEMLRWNLLDTMKKGKEKKNCRRKCFEKKSSFYSTIFPTHLLVVMPFLCLISPGVIAAFTHKKKNVKRFRLEK